MLLATFCAISLCNPLWHRPKCFFEICTHGFLPEENNFCTEGEASLLFSPLEHFYEHTSLRRKTRFIIWSHTFFVMFQRAARLVVGVSIHEVQIACPEFLPMCSVGWSLTFRAFSLMLCTEFITLAVIFPTAF